MSNANVIQMWFSRETEERRRTEKISIAALGYDVDPDFDVSS